MKAEKRVSYDVVITMTAEEAHWIHSMLGSCNGIDNPALRLRKALEEATGADPRSKLLSFNGKGTLPVINVSTWGLLFRP